MLRVRVPPGGDEGATVSETATGDAAERSLTVLRAARTLTAELSVVRDLPSTLQAVVDGIGQLGMDVAVMNLVRPDGDLEVVAISGPAEVHEALSGVVERRESWERLLAAGQPRGSLVYVPAECVLASAPEMKGWNPDLRQPAGPDAWRPGDELFAPLRDRFGELIGILSVDAPRAGRQPGPMAVELFEMYAAHAAITIENARLRDAAAAALSAQQAALAAQREALAAQQEAMALLDREKESFRQAFAAAPTGMAMISMGGPDDGRVLRVNRALCLMLGRSEEELLAGGLLEHVHPEERETATLAGPHSHGGVRRRFVRADGSVQWFAVTALPVEPYADEPGYRLVHLADVTASKVREDRLVHLAHHDPLTGLANRRGLDDAFDDRATALLYCDLDDFKLVNDEYGHQVGDRVLVEVGRRLQAAARAGDVVGRLGGDEFVLVAHDLDEVGAARLARRIVIAVSQPLDDVIPGLRISCTVGVAVGAPGTGTADLLAQADRQLLESKRTGLSSRQARGRPSAR